MTIFLIILAILLFGAGIAALYRRIAIAPSLSFLGLLTLGLITHNGYPVLPINMTILTCWFCMTLVVTIIIFMEPAAVRQQMRGMGYIIIGALAGLAIGLLGFTFFDNIMLLYALMVTGVVAGIFLGLLLYSRTPDGSPIGIGSGNFFRYLLAKGFPTAITVMQPGVVLVIVILLNNLK